MQMKQLLIPKSNMERVQDLILQFFHENKTREGSKTGVTKYIIHTKEFWVDICMYVCQTVLKKSRRTKDTHCKPSFTLE